MGGSLDDALVNLRHRFAADWRWAYGDGKSGAAKRLGRKIRVNENEHVTTVLDLVDDDLAIHMGIPPMFAYRKVDEVPQGVLDWIKVLPNAQRPVKELWDAAPTFYGRGLILWGPPGTGKSTLAANLLMGLVRAEFRITDPSLLEYRYHGRAMGRWVSWQKFVELSRSGVSDSEDAEESAALLTAMEPGGKRVKRADWLVIDDVSRERVTQFSLQELSRILRHRAENGWTTILTLNTHPDRWEDVYGEVMANFLSRQFDVVEVG